MLVPMQKYFKYLQEVFTLIEKEIVPPKHSSPAKPAMNLEVLTCIKMLLKNFGEEFDQKIDLIQFTNDIFYIGFSKQLIDTLSEISKICGGSS